VKKADENVGVVQKPACHGIHRGTRDVEPSVWLDVASHVPGKLGIVRIQPAKIPHGLLSERA
jgi:hypothetical protein